MMPVIASPHACTDSGGKYAGETGIEARLDGQRIGELTKLQSDRHKQTVLSLVKNGRIHGCDGTLYPTDKGWQVELRPCSPWRRGNRCRAVSRSAARSANGAPRAERPCRYAQPRPGQ